MRAVRGEEAGEKREREKVKLNRENGMSGFRNNFNRHNGYHKSKPFSFADEEARRRAGEDLKARMTEAEKEQKDLNKGE